MILVAAAALALAAGVAAATPAAELAQLLPGSYVSRDPPASLRFHVAAVPKSRLADEDAVFYAEAAKSAREGAPFLQRFLLLSWDGARAVLRVYEPRDLAGVRGKWREPESLALFTPRDVRERPDCRMTLVKMPAGHWAGGTAGATCFSQAAEGRVAIAMTISPQTLEWREEGKGAGEISIFGREREGAAPAAAAPAPAPATAPTAAAIPVAGDARREAGFSSKVNEPSASAPPVLEVTSPSSPSKKYGLAELRGMAGADGVPVKRFFEGALASPAAVAVVTNRSGAVSVFSSAEIFSSSGPSLDVSGDAPRLVASPGRGLDDVVSIELRTFGPGR